MRKWLKKLRENNEMSQQNVAALLKVSQQYYNQIENGERQKDMNISLAQNLVEVFGVPIEYILENEKNEREKLEI